MRLSNRTQSKFQCLLLLVFILNFTLHATAQPPKFPVDIHLQSPQAQKCLSYRLTFHNVSYVLIPVPITDAHHARRHQNHFNLRQSSDSDSLQNVRDSLITPRVVAGVAISPFFLALLSGVLISTGRHLDSWRLQFFGCLSNILTKFIAIPFGIGLLIFGLVLGDLEISLVGLSSFSFLGDWAGAIRLVVLLWWSPNLVAMERWHAFYAGFPAQEGKPYTLGVRDPFRGGSEAFRRAIFLSRDETWKSRMIWTDQVIIALLTTKFVVLSDVELEFREDNACPMVNELVHTLNRWTTAFDGQPGKWAREWTSYEDYGRSQKYETTLRFVVVLFTCIRRGKYQHDGWFQCNQLRLLRTALNVPRNNDMSWAFDIVKECFGDKWTTVLSRTTEHRKALEAKNHRTV